MAEYWIVVYRAGTFVTAEEPDEDASVYPTEADVIDVIAHSEDGVYRDVLQVIRVPSDGPPVALAPDYLDRVCREYMVDAEAERQHRQSLRAGKDEWR